MVTIKVLRIYPVGKIAKRQSEGVRFCKFGIQIAVAYCQKYTPTYRSFGDFAHWYHSKNEQLLAMYPKKCGKNCYFVKFVDLLTNTRASICCIVFTILFCNELFYFYFKRALGILNMTFSSRWEGDK